MPSASTRSLPALPPALRNRLSGDAGLQLTRVALLPQTVLKAARDA
jgi:hypothetical protein